MQALRSIEKYLALDKLYVLGTNCVDNGPRDGLEKFLNAASDSPSTVLHYEFVQDYRGLRLARSSQLQIHSTTWILKCCVEPSPEYSVQACKPELRLIRPWSDLTAPAPDAYQSVCGFWHSSRLRQGPSNASPESAPHSLWALSSQCTSSTRTGTSSTSPTSACRRTTSPTSSRRAATPASTTPMPSPCAASSADMDVHAPERCRDYARSVNHLCLT